MATAGPNAAGAGASTGASGTVWSTPGNITVSDNSTAAATLQNGSTATSRNLQATSFGFSIPGGATITGITVSIERRANNSNGSPHDSSVTLLKAGTSVGSNKASASTWPTSDAVATYGNSSDLWGTTWTDTDINNANFGMQLIAARTPGKAINTVQVDFVSITVTYTSGASFIAQPNQRLTQAVTKASFY